MISEIVWLASSTKQVDRKFPTLEMTAQADQEAIWTWPLSSLEKLEIVVAEILPQEIDRYKWMRPEQPGLLEFQARINQRLRRGDLRVTWKFISAADWATSPHATCVADFPQVPKRKYMDIFVRGQPTRQIERESVEAFLAHGGKITRA